MRTLLASRQSSSDSKATIIPTPAPAAPELGIDGSFPPRPAKPARTARFRPRQMSPDEIDTLVHDLQVHQLELEAQNQALCAAQSEISKSRDQYNDLYDFAPIGYATLGRKTNILQANLTLAAMLGLERAKLVGRQLSDFVAGESHDILYLHRRAVLATNQKHSCEVVLRRRDGSAFPALVESVRVPSDRRSAVQFRSVVTDITKLKEAEETLARSHADLEQRVTERTSELCEAYRQLSITEQRFRLMADQAPVMIWLAGPDKLCTWFNRQWLEFRGRKLNEELGTGWTRGIHPEERHQTITSYHKAFDSRQSFILEYRLRRADGKWRWVLDHGAPLFSSDRSFNGFIGSCLDVTERKRLEKEILEISDREKNEIGHDLHDGLCQHLTAVEFRLMALKQELQAVGVHSGAAQAARSAELVRQAIDQTRTLARGLSPVMLEPDGLMTALEELATATRSTFRIPCSFHCPKPVLIRDNSTASHLYRIAQEAVHNAVRHARPDHIAITLFAPKNRLVLVIQDDGVGLRKSRPNQRGMGLHVMQYRAAMIGGSLLLQREPKGGTSVTCSVRR